MNCHLVPVAIRALLHVCIRYSLCTPTWWGASATSPFPTLGDTKSRRNPNPALRNSPHRWPWVTGFLVPKAHPKTQSLPRPCSALAERNGLWIGYVTVIANRTPTRPERHSQSPPSGLIPTTPTFCTRCRRAESQRIIAPLRIRRLSRGRTPRKAALPRTGAPTPAIGRPPALW